MAFAFVFPGQGSQSVGMMAAYGASAVVRATFDEASAALGQDLWQLLAEGPAEALAQTVNTQPVMLTAGVAVYRLWLDRGGKIPAVLAGHSLGEYSALVAAGVIAFTDAVPLVRLRAAAMQEAVPAGTGAMAAILGLDDDRIAEACAEAEAAVGGGGVVEPVNFNGPGQTVIAGSKAAVERACEACKARGAKRALLLPVSAPFHSSLIRPAADKLAARLAQLSFAVPQIPVINNADVAIQSDPERIKDALVRQAYSPVRWVETIRKMAAMDIKTVVECGPGKVLAGLTKRCADGLASVALADLASIDATVANLEPGQC
ncbi:ACP S-malonyltransferase [Accumulibacter sp.]|uniref:ACP S-malonyltransferase n=1 Tax=Accumulibacter sp. TaxID=2053492 RepID=UPI001A601F90|nr:ACP S-malonyltransferase [Accumulibacter sp.]MBL8373894.1 ACP S-malonyltransferase [Accumulibacter sp.]